MILSIPEIIDKIQPFGRYAISNNILNTDWVGGGFACRFMGDSLKIFFDTKADTMPVYVKCEIDGKTEKHAVSNIESVIVIDDLDYKIHDFKIMRITEILTDFDTPKDFLNITHIEITSYNQDSLEPKLLPVIKNEDKKLVFDFYGDSITNGWAGLGDKNGVDFKNHHSDYTITYACKTAERFNADARVCAVSGYGIISKWDGTLGFPFKNFYNLKSRSLPIKTDFTTPPDLIVVALGTNDCGGGVSEADFEKGVIEFISILRKHAPSTEIIWFYGMMNQRYVPTLTDLFKKLSEKDFHISFLPVDNIKTDEFAGSGHPNKRAQLRFADTLENHIKVRLNLK